MRDSHERAWEITSLLSIRKQSLDDFVLNDTAASICGVIVGAETDVVEATHADLNSVLDLADIVGPTVRAGDGQERDSDLISDFDL